MCPLRVVGPPFRPENRRRLLKKEKRLQPGGPCRFARGRQTKFKSSDPRRKNEKKRLQSGEGASFLTEAFPLHLNGGGKAAVGNGGRSLLKWGGQTVSQEKKAPLRDTGKPILYERGDRKLLTRKRETEGITP